ncbi:MAG: 4-hydroxy-tetrahydrodipicolinate reductase [Flavobacteriaceae bacterium]
MKIALLGYGRMGKAIEKIATDRGHKIVIKVDVDTKDYDITLADIAIDFSVPTSAFNNITDCFKNGVPVVSGTTGWLDKYNDAISICKENNGGFISATNFSLGVNVFFELNKQLAKMMANLKEYDITMEEIHHTNKLDAPSGTAITLAEGIINNSDKKNWELDVTKSENSIPIVSKRIPNIPGTHSVKYDSQIDTIEIKHTAHNRDGFALGAVIAAEWLVDKRGIFTMKDVLGL